MTRNTRRRIVSTIAVTLCLLSVIIALVPLGFILFFVVTRGVGALNWDFFTQLPKPVGEQGGGMANAIVGTLMLSGLGAIFAIPVGIVSGVYMSEYAGTRFASAVRSAASRAARIIFSPPPAWTFIIHTPRSHADVTAPATVFGMSWNLRSRKTRSPFLTRLRTTSGPAAVNNWLPIL